MRITMLTGGTRGDVQPYVALGVGLQRAGHHVCVLAPELFRGLITESGLDFGPIRVEWNGVEIQGPQELLRLPEMQAFMPKGGEGDESLRSPCYRTYCQAPYG